MTSTNIFTGMAGEKNSSRVLRPPGGGHTDIFGAPDPPVKRDSGRNASSILEGRDQTVSDKPATPTKATSPLTETAKPGEAAAPSKNRVPPGGYSSGPLW